MGDFEYEYDNELPNSRDRPVNINQDAFNKHKFYPNPPNLTS